MRAGQRAYSAGRYDEAAGHYALAAQTAKRVKDRDEALFMQARMYERGERPHDVKPIYQRIAQADPPGPRRARAEYEMAEWEIEHGDKAAGYALLAKTFRRWPNHGMAKHALSRWVIYTYSTKDEAAVRSQLNAWLEPLAKTEAAQQLKYEAALSWLRDKQPVAAEQQFLRAAREHPYPLGSLTDDAYMWASKAAEQRGDIAAAIAHLDELQRIREISEGGSYNRPMFPQAQMRKALLYRDKLGDASKARQHFAIMVSRYPNSVLADDALWHHARLALAAKDYNAACDLAEDLRDRKPLSRYRRCIKKLCPHLEAIPGERACPDYLLRELKGEKASDLPSPMREGVTTSPDDATRSSEGEM